jgi:glycosyltransferase involved in cell wall biosynthesis
LPGIVLEALAVGVPVVSHVLPGVLWVAEQIVGITFVPLAEDDWAWVSAITLANKIDRQAIRESFDLSDFVLDRALPRHREVWGLS